MENKKSTVLMGSLIASALIGLGTIDANASTLTNYSALGSGSDVRTVLLGEPAFQFAGLELSCGEKKDAKTSETKAKDAKCGEGKCGEGKCGDKKKDAKADGKGDAKTKDAKAKDAKCGEGKCGDKKKSDPKK